MHRVDVVILTAITLEYQAALQVEAGAWEGSRWEEQKGPNGLPVAFRKFHGKGGLPLSVVVAQAGDMGALATTNALLPLVEAYDAQCVAMCGVCAGHPKKTHLGDVIAAERLFFHDAGKRLPDGVQQDIKTYNLRDDWKVALEHFDFSSHFRDASWWKKRPVPYEWQENWLLAKLHEGVADPSLLPERSEHCPQWEKVIEALWASRHVNKGKLTLTDKGRKRIDRLLIKYGKRFPDTSPLGTLLPFKVHVAPMGSGSQVVEDKEVWGTISEYMRKMLGLEMEAAALGALTHAQRERKLDMLVMKGVMDFANHGRDDHFKEFAARASTECLIAFLRANLTSDRPSGHNRTTAKNSCSDFSGILDSGISKPPAKPSPAALLNARYRYVPFFEPGRTTLLNDLNAWCIDSEPVSVRLFHGAGGIGKTRLFIEWCERLRRTGWAAGFLVKLAEQTRFEALLTSEQPVVIVIDYAESRPRLKPLLQLVVHCRDVGRETPLRIALLARSDGRWWRDLLASDTLLKGLLTDRPPTELAPLVAEGPERQEVYLAAVRRFSKILGREPMGQPSLLPSDRRFDRVLYIHMAALRAVEGHSFTAERLMDDTLDHEEHFWLAQAPPALQVDRDERLFTDKARRVVAALTLLGGVISTREGESLVSRLSGTHDSLLLSLLHDLYPGAKQETHQMYVNGLEPDLLGEAMVLRTLRMAGNSAGDLLDQVFEGADERAVRNGFAVLGRLSNYAHEAAGWITRMLEQDVQGRAVLALQAALEAEKAIDQRTAHAVLSGQLADVLERKGTPEIAARLGAVGIPEVSVYIKKVAIWATGKTN